jgi:hypothetical protein
VDPGKYLQQARIRGKDAWQIIGLFVGLAAWADAVVGTFDARNRVGLGYLMTS